MDWRDMGEVLEAAKNLYTQQRFSSGCALASSIQMGTINIWQTLSQK
jgi:hypothetical protein